MIGQKIKKTRPGVKLCKSLELGVQDSSIAQRYLRGGVYGVKGEA